MCRSCRIGGAPGEKMQKTLATAVSFSGTGLHSGAPVSLEILPSPADSGVVFERTDLPQGPAARIAARWDRVVDTRLCTRIANAAGASVSTIEHLMAALAGCGVNNALVRLDGPEVPILDGSAAPFARAILRAGLADQAASLAVLRLLAPVEVRQGAALARLEPADDFDICFEIDFADVAIGHQGKTLRMANGAFLRELCDSRTFCRQADVEAMRASGLALGGTLENAVVFSGAQVLSPGGLRHADEPVRHKMLDALGDLALIGAPLLARYTGVRAGHGLTNRLLHQLFATPEAWHWQPCSGSLRARLPGADVGLADLAACA
jgi:UDP-3-O-[3-hydroxymyristoyl] N-acetylglucosamine deacetylase